MLKELLKKIENQGREGSHNRPTARGLPLLVQHNVKTLDDAAPGWNYPTKQLWCRISPHAAYGINNI